MGSTGYPAGFPVELRFRRKVRFVPGMRELWSARDLIRTLSERDLRARYKQAVLGFAWSIVNPVILMIAFTFFFQRVAHVATGGVPYPLYTYVGLVPWTFFSASVGNGGSSLLGNLSLLNKVYCPREVFPLASVATCAFDAAISCVVLVVLFFVYTFAPKVTTVWTPLLLAIQLAFGLGVTFVVATVTVYLRDLRHAVGILLQLGLFATPIAYPLSVIPAGFLPAYAALNPLGPVIDGYRRAILQGLAPQWDLVGIAAVSATAWLVGGYWMFKKLEPGIADVA